MADPAGLLRRGIKDGFGTRCLGQKRPPIGDRILLRRSRKFIDEAFGHEDIVRRPDAAPEGGRNARRFHPQILDVQVRQRIDQVDRALCSIGVETVVERRRKPSRKDRGASEAMDPGDRHPARVATPEEVASMVVYVASPQASATTGAALRVDGGVVDTIA